MNKIEVSVWMSAYNHDKYISQCLESVFMQKTNFDFEVIIGDDCSSDRTREILTEYKNKYPDKIKLFLPEKNIGMMQMDITTWKLCTGKYLALLNADDYWTDENKLQTQFDFLENNSDTVMCFHQTLVENETDGSSFKTVYLEKDDILPIESLLYGYNPIMTPSVMIRNVFSIPEWFSDLPYGDMPLYLMLAQLGKIRYIDKLMCVYRIHSSGHWQGDSLYNNLLKDLKFYEIMKQRLGNRYESLINKIFAQRYLELARVCIRQDNIEQAKIFFEMLSNSDITFLKENEEKIYMLTRILFDRVSKNDFQELLKEEIKWKVN